MAADDGQVLHGQQFNPTNDFVVPFTETQMQRPAAEALVAAVTANTEVTPTDGAANRVRVYDTSAISTAALAYLIMTAGRLSIELPNVLRGLTVTYNTSSGDGEAIHDAGVAVSNGASGGLNFSPSATAQGSAAVQPDIQPDIYEPPTTDVPIYNAFFYAQGPIVTETELLARVVTLLTVTLTSIVAGLATATDHLLVAGQPFTFPALTGGSGGIVAATTYYVKTVPTSATFTYGATPGGTTIVAHAASAGTVAPTVSAWPTFRPEAVNFTLKGQQVSVNVSADSRHMDRWAATDGVTTALSYSVEPVPGGRSDGRSREVGLTTRSLRIPPTIHALLTLTNTSTTASTSVTATANIPVITGHDGAPSFPPVTNGPHIVGGTVTGSITPTTVAATSGITAIPTYGLYLYRVDVSSELLGFAKVHAILVNFNYYA